MAAIIDGLKVSKTEVRGAMAKLPWRGLFVLGVEILVFGNMRPGFATDLRYTLISPSFGGTDTAPYTYANYQFTQKQAASAATVAAAASAKAAAASASSATAAASPAQQFADSIVSQLQSLVAQKVAVEIANAQPGQAGSINSNGSTITYVNSDGQLTVNITTAAGTTSFSVPSTN